MKVLVINGSPKGKKSNSYQLTRAFLDGMRRELEEGERERISEGGRSVKSGNLAESEERGESAKSAEGGESAGIARDGEGKESAQKGIWVEEIQVNQLNLKPCLGCFVCWEKTPGKCCIQDDMQDVIEKLLWADVTIWSFPLYYYTVPGALKTLIDRQLPMVLPFMTEREDGIGNGSHPPRYDMSGKKTVLISTCGFYTAEGNYDGVYSLFDHMCGRNQYTAVFCGQGELFRVPEVAGRTEEYLRHVREAGREYARGGISERTAEALKQLLFPKEVFERMADASWGIDKESGAKEPEGLIFTRQMAALYQKESYSGEDRVLEMYYTDIDERYQIVLGKDGSEVSADGSKAYTTRIETPIALWRSIGAGEIRGDEAMMKHLYKVKGDFDLMLHWDKYFGNGGSNSGGGAGGYEAAGTVGAERTKGGRTEGLHMPCKETRMSIMLIPWIVFWAAAPIDNCAGALAGIAACVLMPLLFYRYKKTQYDCLTGVLTAGCSIALAAGAPERIVIPLSYLAFGLMWIVSCLGKIPLSAHYSMNEYGGEKALENQLFMKTNRILSLMWGILYLVTPIWTYAIMGTSFSGLTGGINCAFPVILGIFTGWFQKWYPAKAAGGD